METSNTQPAKALFRGRYRILNRVGSGSMGTVYKAGLEEFPDQIVALKILAPEHIGNRRALQRFQNELEACYRISHPNVVRPLEVVREKGVFGYSMEYVDGGNLTSLIGKDLSPIEVVRLVRQIASALNAVHQSGVIHRDVKPENILLTADRTPKLTDFGTALLIGGPRVTTEGNVLGSIPYLSPEYVERQQLDVRSDLYALGVVAFELITGKIPFEGEGLVGVINMKLHGEPPSVRTTKAGTPESLDRAISKLLARAPEDRFQTALSVEEEFRLLELEFNPH